MFYVKYGIKTKITNFMEKTQIIIFPEQITEHFHEFYVVFPEIFNSVD